ncbi:substrate-binding periplasmic protein [Pseudobacteriovorax antillogorgiicola]|nr:transporter substrate-binding domain-containing protein [Pseudobacteriovorax antillogorgiicola]
MGIVHYPPRSDQGPPPHGFTIDLVNEIFKQSKFSPKYTVVNWARSQVSVANGSIDLALYMKGVSASKISDQLDIGKPIFRSRLCVFYNKSKFPENITFNRMSDFSGKYMGNLNGSGLEAFFKNNGLKVVNTSTLSSLFKMLSLGRLDLANADDVSGIHAIFSLGNDASTRIGMLDKPISVTDIFLAIGKHRADHQIIRKQIEQGMAKILKNGAYKRLLDRLYMGLKYDESIIPYDSYQIEK